MYNIHIFKATCAYPHYILSFMINTVLTYERRNEPLIQEEEDKNMSSTSNVG